MRCSVSNAAAATTTVTTTAVQGALGTTIPYTGSTTGWYVGMPVSGANIPANSFVTAFTSGTSFAINNATTTLVASGTVEEKVLALQAEKRALLANVFEASDAAAAKLSLADLKSLLK